MAPLCGRAVLERGELLSDPLCGDRDVLAVGGELSQPLAPDGCDSGTTAARPSSEAFADALREHVPAPVAFVAQPGVAQRLPHRGSVSRFRQNATVTHFDTRGANEWLPGPGSLRVRSATRFTGRSGSPAAASAGARDVRHRRRGPDSRLRRGRRLDGLARALRQEAASREVTPARSSFRRSRTKARAVGRRRRWRSKRTRGSAGWSGGRARGAAAVCGRRRVRGESCASRHPWCCILDEHRSAVWSASPRPPLWSGEGCQNQVHSRCDSVVLVQETTEAARRSTSPPAGDLSCGGSGGRSPSPRWALAGVVLDVDAQDSFEMAAAEDQQVVETLRSDGADEVLGVRRSLAARGSVYG